MANLWRRLIFLLFVATVAKAQYLDTSVCEIVRESYGLIPPPMPANFEIKGEFTDLLAETTTYFEMYFDSTYLRAKYMYLANDIENHILFDYENEQVIEYSVLHPGTDFKRDPLSHTCTAIPMQNSKYKFFFGYKDKFDPKHSKMYDANEALRFGGPYKYAYNGTESIVDRGILTDKFRGCIFDKDFYNMTADYTVYVTNENVGTAAGTLESEVDGTNSKRLLSVPVKVEGHGTFIDQKTKEKKSMLSVENLIWFKGYPVFEDHVFKIPPLMNCKNYRATKAVPKFPLAFSTRVEKTNMTQDIFGKLTVGEVISFEEIWYDNDRQLIRRDYKPVSGVDTEIFSLFQSYGPVKEVYDYRTGVLYVTNKASGRCFTRAIRPGDFFETSSDSIYIKMGTPAEVFRMQTDDMQYKGTDVSRDIKCDVFNGKYDDKAYGKTVTKETYYSTDGWHEEADDKVSYGVPVKHSVIAADIDGEGSESIMEYNFLKFSPRGSPLAVYEVSNCIERLNHKYYGIVINVPTGEESSVMDYRFKLLQTAQEYIVTASQIVSFLRVQKLQVRQIDGKFILLFAMVGHAEKTAIQEKGPSLKEAVEYLRTFINNGNFVIQFVHPVTQEIKPITADPGSLIDLTPEAKQGASLQEEHVFVEERSVEQEPETAHVEDSGWEYQFMFGDEKKDENTITKEGMKPGALAGLSIAMLLIGIAIGIALMYLYIRKFTEQSVERDYQMQHSKS